MLLFLSSKGQNPCPTPPPPPQEEKKRKKKSLTLATSFFLETGATGLLSCMTCCLVEHYCAPSTVLYMQVVLQPLLRLKTSRLKELSSTAASGGSKVKRIFMLKRGHESIRGYKYKTTNKSRIQHTVPALLWMHTPQHSKNMHYLCKLQLRPYVFLKHFQHWLCSRASAAGSVGAEGRLHGYGSCHTTAPGSHPALWQS